MGTFKSSKFIHGNIINLDNVTEHVRNHFMAKGYTVESQKNSFGYFISITKGGIFKAVLGMKTALNIDIKESASGVIVEAKIGVFGQQILPSLIMYFVAWPVLISQISGLVSQAKLDDEAIAVIEEAIHIDENSNTYSTPNAQSKNIFCTECGTALDISVKFCPICGVKQG